MTTVTISGWREGLNKVQLNRLLRRHAGCGLAEAKHAVDRLLTGESLSYEFLNDEAASDFCRSAEALGVTHAWTANGSRTPSSSSVSG